MRLSFYALILAAIFLASGAAFAAESKAPGKAAANPPQAKQELKMQTVELVALIKSTILAVQHANQTGNYSVLRDLGTPVFRERFDQAQLTQAFSNLRTRAINLLPVLFLPPNLTKQPELTEDNALHLVGTFPTEPLEIQYEMFFLQIDGIWRLNGLAVDAVQAPVQVSQSTAPAPTGPAPVPAASPASRATAPVSQAHAQKRPGEKMPEKRAENGWTEQQR